MLGWWGILGKNYKHFREKSLPFRLVVVWFWPSCELLVFLYHVMQHFVRDSWACCEWAGTSRRHRAVLQRGLVLGPGAVLVWQVPSLAGPVPWHLLAWNCISEVVLSCLVSACSCCLIPELGSIEEMGLTCYLVPLLPPPVTGQAVCSEGSSVLHRGVWGTPAMWGVTANPVADQTPKKSKGQ